MLYNYGVLPVYLIFLSCSIHMLSPGCIQFEFKDECTIFEYFLYHIPLLREHITIRRTLMSQFHPLEVNVTVKIIPREETNVI